jgi:hypothetical protein
MSSPSFQERLDMINAETLKLFNRLDSICGPLPTEKNWSDFLDKILWSLAQDEVPMENDIDVLTNALWRVFDD